MDSFASDAQASEKNEIEKKKNPETFEKVTNSLKE